MTSLIVFTGTLDKPLAFAVFPFVVWAATRFGRLGAAIAILLVATVALTGTLSGLGPFGDSGAAALPQYAAFVCITAATSLALAAALAARTKADEALSKSEERLRLAQEGAQITIWDWDVLNQRIAWSGPLEAQLGLAPGGFGGSYDAFFALVHPEDHALVEQSVLRAINDGSDYDVEFRFLRPDGGIRWTASRGRALRDRNGNVTRMLGVAFDITDRRQAEHALRASRRRLDEVVANVDGIVWEVDVDSFRFTFVSPQAERLLGYPLHRWLESGFWKEHLHPDDRQWAVDFCLNATHAGRAHNFEYRMLAADGRVVWLHDIVSVVVEAGKPTRLRGIMVDITPRKQIEAKLRTSEERLSTILDNTAAVVYMLDPEHRYTFVNRQWEKLFHRSREQVEGKTAHEVWPKEFADAFLLANQAVFRAGVAMELEEVAPHDDGVHSYISLKFPLVDSAGTAYALCGISTDITDRKRAEDALRASEARFRTFVDHATDAFFLQDDHGTILDANRQACESLGYAREELVGMRAADIDVDSLPDSLASTSARLHAGEVVAFDTRHRRKDGTVFPVEVRIRLFREGGRLLAVSLARDITERKRVEAERLSHLHFLQSLEQIDRAIQRPQELDRMMADVLDVVLAVFESDRAWLLYPCDPGAPSWTIPMERTRAEYPGAHMMGLRVPTLPEARDVFQAALNSGEPIAYGPKSARPVPAEAARQFSVRSQLCVAVHPKRGAPWLFGVHQCSYDRVWTAEEMSLLKEIGRRIGDSLSNLLFLEDLRSSEERHRELFENAHDLIYIHDLEGNFLSINRAVERASGYSREEALTMNVAQIAAPEELARVKELMIRAGAGEEPPPSLELQLVTKDGRRVALEVSARVVYRAGVPVGVQNIARDVTERKRTEDEIRRLNETLERRVRERTQELEAANRELEAFSYSVSHDLRAPLRAIEGFSKAVLEDCAGSLDEQGRGYLQRVRDGTKRMAQLIEDLLSLSRVTRQEMTREVVDLGALAHRIIGELRDAQPDRDVTFICAASLIVEADPRLLRVLLDNLLGNAWKYTGKHARARIELGVTERNGESGYFVRDDGAGFDMRYADKLFGAFQRLHRSAEFDGTGIGLATARRIVERHGGRIWAESTPEQGATFFFTLPPRR